MVSAMMTISIGLFLSKRVLHVLFLLVHDACIWAQNWVVTPACSRSFQSQTIGAHNHGIRSVIRTYENTHYTTWMYCAIRAHYTRALSASNTSSEVYILIFRFWLCVHLDKLYLPCACMRLHVLVNVPQKKSEDGNRGL